MNVKKVVKKIAALGVGATMLGATIFGAAAADLSDFPKPLFIDNNGAFNGLFVVGATAAGSDVIGLNAITAAVQAAAVKKVATTTTSTSTVEVEGGVDLASGSSQIYLSNELNDRRTTITDDDLSLLSAGTFTKDDGTTVNYEQTILVGDADFKYGTASTAGIKDPKLFVQGDRNSNSNYWYAYKVHFDTPLDLNDDTNVTGQQIELFGKTYTISTDSDDDELVLLGGATDTTLQVGETQEVDFNGEKVSLEVLGIGSSTVASIKVNGVFKEVTEGHTYTIGGQDVYVKTVAEFSGTENAGLVTLQLGADKIKIKNGDQVRKGNNYERVDGTYVSATFTSNHLSEFTVYISSPDTKENKYLLKGEETTDDVFKAVKLQFADTNVDLEGDSRKTIEVSANGNDDMDATFSVKGNSATVGFSHAGSSSATTISLADEDGYTIHTVEGAEISENEYFFLNYGDYQHLMQLDSINYASSSPYTDSDISFTDVFTGTTYTIDSWDSASASELDGTKVIDGATYYVQVMYNGGSPYVKFTVSSESGESGATYGDTGNYIQIFQYLEPVSGSNARIWFADDSVAVNVSHENQTVYFVTPTGTSSGVTIDTSTTASGSLTVSGSQITYRYDYNNESNYFNFTISVDSTDIDQPSVLFREDKDSASEYHVVALRTTRDTSSGTYYTEATTPLFSHSTTYSGNYEGGDYTGYVDYFGTFVKVDSSDSSQKAVDLWYSTDQLYGKFYIAPVSAETTTSTSTSYSEQVVPIPSSASVLDTEVNDWAAQNMIVVGGPCVNSVAAALMGNPADCTAGFELGKAKIKLFDENDGMNAGKVALLVAGYSAEDTRRAATVLANYADYADQLKGTEVEVTGTSLTDITVSTPTTE